VTPALSGLQHYYPRHKGRDDCVPLKSGGARKLEERCAGLGQHARTALRRGALGDLSTGAYRCLAGACRNLKSQKMRTREKTCDRT
jgi:hypothetical protein